MRVVAVLFGPLGSRRASRDAPQDATSPKSPASRLLIRAQATTRTVRLSSRASAKGEAVCVLQVAGRG